MSADIRYIISYEPQPYSGNFPLNIIARLNDDKSIPWLDEIRKIDSFNYYCYVNSPLSHENLVSLKADQILFNSGGKWKEVNLTLDIA